MSFDKNIAPSCQVHGLLQKKSYYRLFVLGNEFKVPYKYKYHVGSRVNYLVKQAKELRNCFMAGEFYSL